MLASNIKSLASSSLSHYRTLHHFERFGEITSIDDLFEYCKWATDNKVEIYILGNGSNTLFTKKRIKSLVLKNKLPKYINSLDDFRVEVSSSVSVMDILKYCCQNSLDSFYYLASVPATIGGALAMNAGRGKSHGCTIYDFVESITFFENGDIKTLKGGEVVKGYRETIFTGKHSKLILSAVFSFERKEFEDSPILSRQNWSKDHQDNIAPNCGSVFKLADFSILRKLKGLAVGKSSFSTKTDNWILNKSKSSFPIILLIRFTQLIHFITTRKAVLEIVTVD